jgi:ERCC4-type nuclease
MPSKSWSRRVCETLAASEMNHQKRQAMSTEEAKTEIIELLDQIPDEHIPRLLEYVKYLKHIIEIDEAAASHLEDIMEEDDDLLKRLAE